MSNRAPTMLVLIAILALVAIYANLDLVRPGYEHSRGVVRLLSWQGEEAAQRSLRLREGLDLQGGLQVLLQADMRGSEPGDLDRAATTIKNRVDALGVTEPLVQTQGADKIVVELPGVKDKDLALRTIGQTALLEFVYSATERLESDTVISTTWRASQKLFADLPADQQVPFLVTGESEQEGVTEPVTPTLAATTVAEPTTAVTATLGTAEGAGASEPVTVTEALTAEVDAAEAITVTEALTAEVDAAEPITATEAVTAPATAAPDEAAPAAGATGGEPTETKVYPTVLTGENLQRASIGLNSLTSEIVVDFMLNTEGGRMMREFTAAHHSAENSGEPEEVMPIVLDGKVISSPAVRDEISNQGSISGRFTRPEAEVLVAQLNSGSLPVNLTVVGQTGIGPTLGRQSLEAAVKGGLVGLIVVMLFMLVYYRMPGALADLALVLYALLVLMLFRMLPVTLTLAGFAGFILSLGMAVDANILIFERMKEELRGRRSLAAAMDIGFKRAWPSIRDSNMSTLITCVILFWFGSQFGASIVKGFAVTLFIGVVVSLFTAIFVTRNLLWLANRVLVGDSVERGTPSEDSRLRFLFGF